MLCVRSGQMIRPVGFLPVVTLLSLASCQVIRVPDSSSQPEGALLFRIENATASPTDVTVQISAVEAQSVEGGPQTPTNTLAEQSLASEATIRVGPGDFSEGTMGCGPRAVVTAVVGDGTQVALSGSGAGTPAFDQGSVGLTGERFLLFESDYICGDVVVVRIEDNGTGVGTSSSSIGLGSIAVYAADDLPDVDLPTFDKDPDAGSWLLSQEHTRRHCGIRIDDCGFVSLYSAIRNLPSEIGKGYPTGVEPIPSASQADVPSTYTTDTR